MFERGMEGEEIRIAALFVDNLKGEGGDSYQQPFLVGGLGGIVAA